MTKKSSFATDLRHADLHHHHHLTTATNHHHNHRQHNGPPPVFSHYYPHSSSSSSSSSTSIKGCCCLILLFSFLTFLTLTLVLVIILAIKPKKPQFDMQQVGVQYNLAAPAPTAASLSLAVRMLFTAINDNTVGIQYGASTFNIMYRGIPLGRGSVPGFFQPAHSVRQVQTTVTVDRVNLLQADAAELVKDSTVNDRVELRILGDINAKIRTLELTSPSVQVS